MEEWTEQKIPIAELEAKINTNMTNGLTSAQASDLLKKWGPNSSYYVKGKHM